MINAKTKSNSKDTNLKLDYILLELLLNEGVYSGNKYTTLLTIQILSIIGF
jgi:hypothetical protein